MDKHSTKRLLDSIRKNLNDADVRRIRFHLETLIESYHTAQERISALEGELAYANFDRECLEDEKLELEIALGATDDGDDEQLIVELIKEGIQRDEKIAAVKYVKKRTGWSLTDSKTWVEEHYCE